MEIRKALVSHFINKLTAPLKEGVNTVEADGYAVKFQYALGRKLDETALDAVMSQFPEESPFRQLGVLINYKPALVMDGYRSLPEDLQKIFDQALVVTESAPTIKEIVPITRPEDVAACIASDPATAPAVPDWPAKVATPIMDAYHKAKGETAEVDLSQPKAKIKKVSSKTVSKPSKKGKK